MKTANRQARAADQSYIDQLIRARYLAESGLGKRGREASGSSLSEVKEELRRRGAAYSQPNLSRIERGLRRPCGEAGAAWGQLMDELLRQGGVDV